MWFLIKGFIIGFAIAAPVGPIAIHCIRKTLQFGRLPGLFSGMGAAFADLVYGFVAAFGLTFVSHLLLAGRFWFRLVGGIFLILLGIKTFLARPSIEKEKKVTHISLFKDFITTFFLTISNPLTILSFVAVFAGLGLIRSEGSSVLLVLGVFLGSAMWWLLLCEFVTLFRKKIEEKMMLWINRIAGVIIFGFGIAALVYGLFFSKVGIKF